jgi:uncharacterized membrane protein
MSETTPATPGDEEKPGQPDNAITTAHSQSLEAPPAQTQLVVAAYNDVTMANNAFTALAAKRGQLGAGVKSVAFIQRDTQGKVEFKETGQASTGATAAAAGVLGGLIGLVLSRGKGGGALIGAGLGAALGGVGSKYVDVGIPDERLREIGALLQPGSLAVAALVDNSAVAQVKSELGAGSTMVTSEALTVDLVAKYGGGDVGRTLAEIAGATQSAVASAEDAAMANQTVKSAVDAAKKTADDLMQNETVKGAVDSVKGAVDSATKAVNDATKSTPAS